MTRTADWLGGVVAVGGGRGFVLELAGERLVVTAAHCLPCLPPCASYASSAEKTYPELLGRPGATTTVPAECRFADPVADLAVLGPPDERQLPTQFRAYRALVASTNPLPIGVLPSGRKPIGNAAFLLTLDGRWFACEVTARDGGLWIAHAAEPIRGGSGSPIMSPTGCAVGVLCTASSARNYTSGGPNPELSAHLPNWMLRGLQPQPASSAVSG